MNFNKWKGKRVLFDEFQFYSYSTVKELVKFVEMNQIDLIATGLLVDCLGDTFRLMADLVSYADQHTLMPNIDNCKYPYFTHIKGYTNATIENKMSKNNYENKTASNFWKLWTK
jgi:thymidine kinase